MSLKIQLGTRIAAIFTVTAMLVSTATLDASSRPALILPGNADEQTNGAPSQPDRLTTPLPEKPDIAPLAPDGSTLRMDGVDGSVVSLIADRIGCPVPKDLADDARDLPAAPINCIARELGIDFTALPEKRRATLLAGIGRTVRRQVQEDRAAGNGQAFIQPFNKSFGRLAATFTSNIAYRYGHCASAIVSWRLPDVTRGSLSEQSIVAGRAAPVSAYLLRERDVRAMIAATPDHVRSTNLPYATCTRSRPATVAFHIGMGKREIARLDVAASAFFRGGDDWAAFVDTAAARITGAANAIIRGQGDTAHASARRFRDTYGDFENPVLMRAIINGTYRPKDFLPAHQLAIRRMFVRYHVLYSDECYAKPPRGLSTERHIELLADRIFTTRTFVYTSRNARTGEDVAPPRQFHIREKYADRVSELAHEELNNVRNPIFMEQGLEAWAKSRLDIDNFFKRQGCFGANVEDFERHLFEAATFKWDAQRERGIPFQLHIPGVTPLK